MISLQPGGRLSSRTLFAVALLLHALVFLMLLGDSRMPRGQVTRDFLATQHALLAGSGPIAGPSPLLLMVLRPLGPLLASRPFLPLFHVAMFVDELLLLVGTWLLARRFWESPVVVFFVTVAAAGSELWTDHIYANFYAIQTVPLAVWLILEFLETQARRYFLAAAVLLALQGTVSAALATAAAVSAGAILSPRILERIRALRWTPRDGAWLLALAVPLGLSLLRPPMPAAAPRLPGEILDLLLGLSLVPDVTVYCGVFTIGLAVHGLARGEPQRTIRLGAAAVAALLVLSLVGPVLPFVKLVVIGFAGLGLQKLLEEPRGGLVAAIGLLLLAAVAGILSIASLPTSDAVEHHLRPFLGVSPRWTDTTYPRDPRNLSDLFGAASMAAGAAGAILLLFRAGRRTRSLALALLLFVHPMDVYGWKSRMVWFRTTAAGPMLQRIGEPPATFASGSSARWLPVSAASGFGAVLGIGLLAKLVLRELRRRPGAAP